MAVKIGSARIDENGNAKGGKAGDQTGKEVSTQNWYLHSKGWRVFRAIDPSRASKIAWDMASACENNNIGYDQGQRNTLYTQAEKVGFNCAAVKTKCETDCSALVRVCCAYAGIMLPNFRTDTEPNVLLKSGYFEEMKGTKYQNSSDYLCVGDILVTKKQGHTVIVLTNGKCAENRETEYNTVLVTGGSVNVRAQPKTSGKVYGIAHKGDTFPYLGEMVDNRWFKIRYKEKDAYISNRYSHLIMK